MHVGAGKLGLSLVVPAISSQTSDFAVVDTPRDPAWARHLEEAAGPLLKVEVNGARITELRFGTDAAAPGDGPRLVVSDDEQTLGQTIAAATTVSCSLGPHLRPVMTRLFRCAEPFLETGAAPPTLYCCENDHAAVEALRDDLAGAASVVDCMVDRVSTERAVGAKTIRVRAESYGGAIVSLDPMANEKRAPPFGGKHGAEVLAPRSGAAAAFLADRKLELVNGMHTTLAFLTLREAHATSPGDLLLARPRELDQDELWQWCLARAATLVHKHGVDARGLDREAFAMLEDFAHEALDRFDDAPDDTVARVLGGGVATRWRGRLASCAANLEEALAAPGPATAFLAYAGASADEVLESVSGLVAATEACCVADEARVETETAAPEPTADKPTPTPVRSR